MKSIQFPANIQKVQTLSDGGNKLVIETQELNPDDMSVLFSLKGMMWCCLSETQVNQYDLRGNFIATYASIKEAGESTNIRSGNISSVLLQRQKTAGGYKWEYAAR
jgi:hypothetical protein